MSAAITAEQGDAARALAKRYGKPKATILHAPYAGTDLERYGLLEITWSGGHREMLRPNGKPSSAYRVTVAGMVGPKPALRNPDDLNAKQDDAVEELIRRYGPPTAIVILQEHPHGPDCVQLEWPDGEAVVNSFGEPHEFWCDLAEAV